MIAEIRLIARLARELCRFRTLGAVIVIARDDNRTDTWGLSTGDSTEKILYVALRQLPRLADRIHHVGLRPFSLAAENIAHGLVEMWPRFPLPVLRVEIGPPAARVTVRIELDGVEVAAACIGESPRITENMARQVKL
jgi:hypothetical protein